MGIEKESWEHINVTVAKKKKPFVGAVLVDFKYVMHVFKKTNGGLVMDQHGYAQIAKELE